LVFSATDHCHLIIGYKWMLELKAKAKNII